MPALPFFGARDVRARSTRVLARQGRQARRSHRLPSRRLEFRVPLPEESCGWRSLCPGPECVTPRHRQIPVLSGTTAPQSETNPVGFLSAIRWRHFHPAHANVPPSSPAWALPFGEAPDTQASFPRRPEPGVLWNRIRAFPRFRLVVDAGDRAIPILQGLDVGPGGGSLPLHGAL